MASLYEEVLRDVQHITALVSAQFESLRHEKSFDAASVLAVQSENCRRRLRSLKHMSPEETVALQGLILKGPWTGEQKTGMVEILSQAAATPSGSPQTAFQNLDGFVGYLSKKDLTLLGDKSINNHMKLNCLAERALALGLRKPSELAFKVIMGAGCAAGLQMDGAEHLPFLAELKRLIRVGAKRLPPPVPYVAKYPSDPGSLDANLLASSYKGDEVGHFGETGSAAALQAQQTLPCRSTKRTSSSQQLSIVQPPKRQAAPQQPAMTAGNEMMAMMMMTFMQQMMPGMQHMMPGMGTANTGADIDLTMFPKAAGPQPAASDSQDDSQEASPAEKIPIFDIGVEAFPKPDALMKGPLEQAKLLERALEQRAVMKKPASKKDQKAMEADSQESLRESLPKESCRESVFKESGRKGSKEGSCSQSRCQS